MISWELKRRKKKAWNGMGNDVAGNDLSHEERRLKVAVVNHI